MACILLWSSAVRVRAVAHMPSIWGCSRPQASYSTKPSDHGDHHSRHSFLNSTYNQQVVLKQNLNVILLFPCFALLHKIRFKRVSYFKFNHWPFAVSKQEATRTFMRDLNVLVILLMLELPVWYFNDQPIVIFILGQKKIRNKISIWVWVIVRASCYFRTEKNWGKMLKT